ncbi:hypothetical protein MAR_013182 [Mya arenaria]|uniref:Uncharacterized protein n=1 Tax=Mya arenaria TaxID=6604 RepID=A0ABY7FZ47_MYAAR|nr:hypothetical protein MAR_013182 [Mya arenaria]
MSATSLAPQSNTFPAKNPRASSKIRVWASSIPSRSCNLPVRPNVDQQIGKYVTCHSLETVLNTYKLTNINGEPTSRVEISEGIFIWKTDTCSIRLLSHLVQASRLLNAKAALQNTEMDDF